MRTKSLTLIGWLGIGLASFGLGACLDEGGEAVATGGASGSGGTDLTGGVGVTGGTAGTAPSGGASGTAGTANGGVTSTGGVGITGGTDSGGTGSTTGGAGGVGTGGTTATGGTGAGMGGTAGASGGVGGGSGGRGGMGATSGAGGTAGSTATGGSGGSGGCVKGQTLGKEVVMIGESFIAATHRITQQVETRAKAAGSLAQSDRYVDNSQSGTTLANNQIPSQYTRAVQSSGTIKYVLMDGGGNDCLINNNGNAALTAATALFQTMAQNNTQKVVYFFYPDPIGSNFSNLKTCLDNLRPQMKAICDGLTSPKCYWLDLREVWNGHPEYTSDGIHPTTAGSNATGDAIWEVMVDNCVAQ
jgi:hypothetical protein